jgi:predicted component of type VI protein secretion system
MNDKYSPSFLDRLIDTHGRAGTDHEVRLASLTQIKDNVARDLEALLKSTKFDPPYSIAAVAAGAAIAITPDSSPLA